MGGNRFRIIQSSQTTPIHEKGEDEESPTHPLFWRGEGGAENCRLIKNDKEKKKPFSSIEKTQDKGKRGKRGGWAKRKGSAGVQAKNKEKKQQRSRGGWRKTATHSTRGVRGGAKRLRGKKFEKGKGRSPE